MGDRRMIKSRGPVQAKFTYFDETLNEEATFECVLEDLKIKVLWDEAKRVELADLLDQPLVCFGPDTLAKVVFQETELVKNAAGRYGRVRKVRRS
jgi:hypothetical protein